MKDRSGSHGNLVIAVSALKQMTRDDVAVLFIAAVWTRIPIRPSDAREMLPARVLIRQTILELKKIHRFLVHWLDPSLCFGGGNITPTRQSHRGYSQRGLWNPPFLKKKPDLRSGKGERLRSLVI
jgi:hypothetical protein